MDKKRFNSKKIYNHQKGTFPGAFALSCLRPFVFLCFCSFYAACAWSQDWDTDLAKATRIFREEAFEIEIEHLFFPSLSAVTPTEQQRVKFLRQGDKFRLEQYGMEIVSDGRYLVFIHPEAQLIGIEPRHRPDASQPPSQGWKMIMQTLEQISLAQESQATTSGKGYTCTYLGRIAKAKAYRINYDYGEYQESTVYFSGQTGLLERINVVFRQPVEVEPGISGQVRVSFVYKKQEGGKKIDHRYFSIDDIVTVNSKGEVKLKEKYNKYQLLNHLR
ncbi:MAG: hypothetical protein LBR52_00010 [Prevotellaceae bacterium]|nr:hypothetical protein [Prevotellaceae bacterium]